MSVGLSRRELERTFAWVMKSAPQQPEARIQYMASAIIKLIDLNNQALATALTAREDGSDD